jgi:hypothetical protein
MVARFFNRSGCILRVENGKLLNGFPVVVLLMKRITDSAIKDESAKAGY